MTTVLVTGARGMLGRDLVEALAPRYEVVAVDLPDLDIRDAVAVGACLEAAAPEVVIHCAAMTDVDGCESRADEAMRVNWLGTRNVARACRAVDAALVYLSTDYVFSGNLGRPYDEWDLPSPLSVYGRSKSAGETEVRETVRRHFIVRTSGLYGRHGRNFVRSILAASSQCDEVRVVQDQVCRTTYTRDLAAALAHLVATDWYGTLHLTNTGEPIPWSEWARLVLAAAGRNTRVIPIASSELARPAPRPAMSALAEHAWRLQGGPPMPSSQDALARYLREMEGSP